MDEEVEFDGNDDNVDSDDNDDSDGKGADTCDSEVAEVFDDAILKASLRVASDIAVMFVAVLFPLSFPSLSGRDGEGGE